MEFTYVLGVIVCVEPTLMHDMEKKGEKMIQLHRIIFKFLSVGHLTFVNFLVGIKIMCFHCRPDVTRLVMIYKYILE